MKPTDESAQADAKQRPAPEPTQVGIANLRAPRQQTMLAPPAAGADSTWVAGAPRARDDSAEPAGSAAPAIPEVLGPYRLLASLGAGGMGQVWLAERADGVYVQRVAIKIMASVLGDPNAVLRATAERQFLATLEHPGITRVLDGGTTAAGQPYVVMEYVDGVSIDEYCRARLLPLRARVELFLSVLDAVDAAHRALIVHRDLKPSNVMVNREGQVKLVDFGIAKALGQGNLPASATQGLGPMTPSYASPEQFEGKALTTACDVWALGVLLYELLTGTTPFATQHLNLHQIPALLAEGLRTRASGAVRADELGLGERESRSWRRMLQGDLDRVLAKALTYEPERRYASARAFADDLERWLAHEPVHARSGGAWYRSMKFMRRHRLPVAAAVVALITLVGGLVATSRQAQIAERERNNARDVGAVLAHMLSNANPSVAGGGGGQITIATVMQRIADQLTSGGFDARPEVKAELALIIGENFAWQGRYEESAALANLRIATIRSQLQSDADLQLMADAEQAAIAFNAQDFAASNAGFEQAVPKLRRAWNEGAIPVRSLVLALNNWGYLRRTQGDSIQAGAHFREALELAGALAPEEFYLISTTRSVLASTLADQGQFDAALATAADAVREFETVAQRRQMPDYGFAMTVHAGFLVETGDLAPAQRELLQAEQLFRSTVSEHHLWLGDNLRNQALLWLALDDVVRAERAVAEARQIYDHSFSEKYDHYPTVLMIQAEIAARSDDPATAERLFRKAVQLRETNMPEGHYFTAISQSALGAWLARRDPHSEEAKRLLQTSHQSLVASQGADNPRTLLARRRLEQLGH